jgi:hypothetical protein
MSEPPEGTDIVAEEPETTSGVPSEENVRASSDGQSPEVSQSSLPSPSLGAVVPVAMRGRRARRRIVVIGAVLFVVFLATVAMRSPWRGFLADGDSWVTGQALRWLRTWHRDGALASAFALVVSPPTAEYEGKNQLTKWALPGHPILLYYALGVFGGEPTLDRIMGANLLIHLALALMLAFLAYYLAALAKPESWRWPTFVALHCGLFTLLLPPILFWGQNLSCQYFTVLPFLLVVVAGRRLRDSFPTERGRRAVDQAVRVSVFAGTFTDFLFWLLIPYFRVARWLRSRRGLAPTSEPWKRTLRGPYRAAMLALMALFLVNGHIGIMINRALTWTVGTQGGGPFFFFATRVWFFAAFFAGHFYDAFGLLGFFCIVLALLKLLRRRRREGIPEPARGILLDLLLPGLLFTFVLSPHEAVHTVAAIQYVPFLALAWTLLTPLAVAGIRGRWRRKAAWTVYVVFAFVSLWPSMSGWRRDFPRPRKEWTREARFLRENTLPSDRVFSPATEIEILPPQRIALAERAVHHVYGPLDIAEQTAELEETATIAVYGRAEDLMRLGTEETEGPRYLGRSLARVSLRRFRRFVDGRVDAPFRAREDEILRGAIRPRDEAVSPFDGESRPPELPVAFHLRYGPGAGDDKETLYWKDETHFHIVAPDGERVVRGEEAFHREFVGIWDKLDEVDDRAAELGSFLVRAFHDKGDDKDEGEAVRFPWGEYEVIRRAVGPGPAAFQKRYPSVGGWDAYLVYAGEKPMAMVLGPTVPSGEDDAWISVVLDDVVGKLGGTVEVAEEWKVVKRRDPGR